MLVSIIATAHDDWSPADSVVVPLSGLTYGSTCFTVGHAARQFVSPSPLHARFPKILSSVLPALPPRRSLTHFRTPCRVRRWVHRRAGCYLSWIGPYCGDGRVSDSDWTPGLEGGNTRGA